MIYGTVNFTFISLKFRPKSSKEALAATSSAVTENLMSLSRMMAGQVQQSEQTMSTLSQLL